MLVLLPLLLPPSTGSCGLFVPGVSLPLVSPVFPVVGCCVLGLTVIVFVANDVVVSPVYS